MIKKTIIKKKEIFVCLFLTLLNYIFSIRVIWNGPSENCQKNETTTINFTKYNIEANTNYTFKGDKIVLLYESEVGTYPHIIIDKKNASNITFIHGGLPQVSLI